MSSGDISMEGAGVAPLESQEVVGGSNPWKSIYSPIASESRAPEKPKVDDLDYRVINERNKARELLTEAKLSIHIDRDALDAAQLPRAYGHIRNADIVNAAKAEDMDFEQAIQINKERADKEREQELNAFLDRIKRLPDDLSFQPGLTLIVGENGLGKSTLAKAIYFAVRARESSDLHYRASTDPEYLEEQFLRKMNQDLDPKNRAESEKAFLVHAGLAKIVAPAIRVHDYQQGQATQQPYFDVPDIIGKKRQQDLDRIIDPYGTFKDVGYEINPRVTGSHRQTVDFEIEDLAVNGNRSNLNKPGIFFIDEPETGMSPRRHRNLQEELTGKIPEGSIAILPTNSIVLSDSDLPRIDLEHPERGIFRPSEYPVDIQGN